MLLVENMFGDMGIEIIVDVGNLDVFLEGKVIYLYVYGF